MRQSATRTGKPAARQRTCKLLAQTLIVLTLALALPSGVQASLAIGNNGSFTQRWRDRAPVPTVAFAHAVRGQAASAGGIVKAGIGASAVTDGVTTSPTAPTVTSFTPTSGPEGATVTITGTSFADASKVTFSGTSSTFKVLSSTRITAIVPTRTASGRIAVTNPVGTGSSSTDFTVIPTPAVTSFTPPSGPVSTVVTIDGRGFAGATKVTFNGTAATFSLVSSARISATVPIGATSGRIAITTPGGTATSAAGFTVTKAVTAPKVTAFSPASGPVGTSVTVTGSSFTGATRVTFNGAAATFSVLSAAQLRATVPSGATTGRIAVTTPGGTAMSAGSFAVIPAPTVTAFTPAAGAVCAVVTLTGTGLTGATAVTFNGVAATVFSVLSAAQLTATVPSGATTGRIAVTTPGGAATSGTSFTVSIPTATLELWVDPANGNDAAAGTSRATALRTLSAAWERVPAGGTLAAGHRIRLVPGRFLEDAVPGWMDARHATAGAPLVIEAADGRGTVTLPNLNIHGCSHLQLHDVAFESGGTPETGGGNTLHFEACDHVLVDGCRSRVSAAARTTRRRRRRSRPTSAAT